MINKKRTQSNWIEKKGERKVFQPMHTTTKTKNMQKKHIINPPPSHKRILSKKFWGTQTQKVEKNNMSELFILFK